MIRVGIVVVAVLAMVGAMVMPDLEKGKEKGEIWAVLVAGSNTWMNYRHQADVCHAYQILHQHGVPDDHIIVMMYDDLAHSRENPRPGVVINRPNGPNVYEGVPTDYTGSEVTPQNFLKVLSGDSQGLKGIGSGKVLKSGPNDRVFINLVDHGAPGIFGFPVNFLHVKDFNDAIQNMHQNKQYKKMVIYLESCESGSMFESLPDDINVYALSAANSTQSSYACYFDKTLGTFLGDVFSIKWMEDTDRENVNKETLEKQFKIVEAATTTSHVLQWGEKELSQMKVSAFVGNKDAPPSEYGPFDNIDDPCLDSSVANPDVPLSIILTNKENADDMIGLDYWTSKLNELNKNRTFVKTMMTGIVKGVTKDSELVNEMMNDQHHKIRDYTCHKEATKAWHELCFDMAKNPYALRLVHVIVNLCEHGFSASDFSTVASHVCKHRPVSGIQ